MFINDFPKILADTECLTPEPNSYYYMTTDYSTPVCTISGEKLWMSYSYTSKEDIMDLL